MTEKTTGLVAVLRTPAGGAVVGMALMAVVWLLAGGILKPSDFRGGNAPIVNEATRLVIDASASAASEKAVEKYDERWKEWRVSIDQRLMRLENRDRWMARNDAGIPRNP